MICTISEMTYLGCKSLDSGCSLARSRFISYPSSLRARRHRRLVSLLLLILRRQNHMPLLSKSETQYRIHFRPVPRIIFKQQLSPPEYRFFSWLQVLLVLLPSSIAALLRALLSLDSKRRFFPLFDNRAS